MCTICAPQLRRALDEVAPFAHGQCAETPHGADLYNKTHIDGAVDAVASGEEASRQAFANAQALHAAVERAAVQAQQLGGTALMPAAAFQGVQQRGSLGL